MKPSWCGRIFKRGGKVKDLIPDDFMFSLTRQEIMNLSQSVISSKMTHSPSVFVFTEQGVAMLSSVLNSRRAILINIQIMRAFAKLREILASHKDLRGKIETMEKRLKNVFIR